MFVVREVEVGVDIEGGMWGIKVDVEMDVRQRHYHIICHLSNTCMSSVCSW